MERLLETVSFDAAENGGSSVEIDAAYVDKHLGALAKRDDLRITLFVNRLAGAEWGAWTVDKNAEYHGGNKTPSPKPIDSAFRSSRSPKEWARTFKITPSSAFSMTPSCPSV